MIVEAEMHRWLLDNPGVQLSIDIPSATLTLPDGRQVEFPIDGFARHCLVEGVDQLGFLRQQLTDIERFEETRNWKP